MWSTLNVNGSFTFYVDVFFPLSMPRRLPDMTVIMSNMAGVLQEANTANPSRATEFISGFLLGSVLLIFSSLLLLSYYVFYVLNSVL